MDPRIPITTKANGETFALGRRFKSLAEAEVEVARIIAKREAIAGRSLSARELRDGVSHRDNMTTEDKVAAQNWHPTMPPEPEGEKNVFRKARLEPKEPRNRRELMARAEREYDAKLAGEAAKAVVDPRRQAAIAHVEDLWEQVAFDPTATSSDLVAVEQLRRQSAGDLKEFKQMSETVVAKRAERHGELTKAAQVEFERARVHLEALKPPGAFEGSNFVPPGAKVHRLRGVDGEEISVVMPGEKYSKVLHTWKADEAPADVAALAPNFGEMK